MGKVDKTNTDPVWLRIKSLNTGRRGEQTELMEFCQVPQNTYNGWDCGTLKSYTKHVVKIAEFYDVSTDWILTGKGIKRFLANEIISEEIIDFWREISKLPFDLIQKETTRLQKILGDLNN